MRGLQALWIALLLCAGAPAVAQELGRDANRLFQAGTPLEIEADSLEYEVKRDLYVARGEVRIRQGELELTADWVAFSKRTRRGVASGDVVLTDGEDVLHTRFIEFDIDTLEGVMFDAEFEGRGNQLELRGEEIAKTGERTYRFRNGRFTTCRCPDPEAREPWEITAGEADLEIEGYGTARNTTLEILGVPVLWLPWMIYPLKTERQSGLLFPELAISGRNGFEVGVPVFWAVADPVNLIFTPRWLQKRGAKGDLEIEYVVGEESGGDFFGAGLYDQEVNADTLKTPFEKGRWATRGSHDLFLPGEWRFQSRYAFASDNSYPNDFDDLGRYRQDRFLPAEASVGRTFGGAGRVGVRAGAAYFDDLQNPDDTDRDPFVLNRLPEAGVEALPAEMPFLRWLVPSLGFHYAWFEQQQRPQNSYDPTLLVTNNGRFLDTGVDGLPTSARGVGVEQGREGGGVTPADPDPNLDNNIAFDPVNGTPNGTEGDGLFQEGELLADSGHRALLTPKLGLPLRLADALELYPEVGWHETLYQSDAQGFERAGFLTGRVDLRSRLRRGFGDVVHLLEPRLGWAFVQDISQRGKPLYVPATGVPQRRLRELDLDNVTSDWADRISAFNGINFGFGNRLYDKHPEHGVGARLLADFVVSGLYDFSDLEFGRVYLDGRAYPFRGATTRFSAGFDPGDAAVTEGLLSFAWAHEAGHRFGLGYRYIRDVPRFFERFPRQNERFKQFTSDFDHVNQIDAGFRVAITEQWGVTYRGVYSFERSLIIGNEGGLEYISRCRCWAGRIEVAQSRSRGVSVNFLYTLIGVGDDTRTPFESQRTGAAAFLDGF